jgi:hypothetical protein
MTFKPGDWIEHLTYGTGLITGDTETLFVVRFISKGEKKMSKDCAITRANPPHPQFTFSETSRARGAQNSKHAPPVGLSFEHLLERFKAIFPGGFEDTQFVADERRYKEAAVANFLVRLGRGEMSVLIAAEKYDEIARRAKQCASHNSMNLIFRHELMSVSDALKAPELQRQFSLALFDVLYGEGDQATLFEQYVGVLDKIGCLKWTIATYYQFLATKGASMFMKPKVSKVFAVAVGVDLMYQPIPTWNSYQRLNQTAAIVRQLLLGAGMNPRDGIDLQSFMYRAWDVTK